MEFYNIFGEFQKPSYDFFSVYSKINCPNCTKIKNILQSYKIEYNEIQCDEYLINNKDDFLNFISFLADIKIKQFPIIFYKGKYIGGYKETELFIMKNFSLKDDEDF
jgi:glutaredoxin